MDAGSGAIHPVSETMIQNVSQSVGIPLIVGGGISTPELAVKSAAAGADVIVIGNVLEKDPLIINEMADALQGLKPSDSIN